MAADHPIRAASTPAAMADHMPVAVGHPTRPAHIGIAALATDMGRMVGSYVFGYPVLNLFSSNRL